MCFAVVQKGVARDDRLCDSSHVRRAAPRTVDANPFSDRGDLQLDDNLVSSVSHPSSNRHTVQSSLIRCSLINVRIPFLTEQSLLRMYFDVQP